MLKFPSRIHIITLASLHANTFPTSYNDPLAGPTSNTNKPERDERSRSSSSSWLRPPQVSVIQYGATLHQAVPFPPAHSRLLLRAHSEQRQGRKSGVSRDETEYDCLMLEAATDAGPTVAAITEKNPIGRTNVH